MSKDYYKVLEVEKDASQEDIKKAFRKKAHQFHPDKPNGSEEKFKEINEAYQVVGNEEKRQQYDQFGADFNQQGGFGGGMNWDDFMNQARQGGGFSSSGFGVEGMGLGDIFSEIFGFGGGGARASRRTRGGDIEADIEISLKDAFSGVTKEVEFYKTVKCGHCKGNKAEPGTPIKDCAECGGQGVVERVQQTILGAMRAQAKCPQCQGEGKKYETACKECSGQGVVKENTKTKVDIPRGIDHGNTLRINGEGEAAASGQSGDLYLHVRVKDSRDFERQGNDLLSEVEISPAQAALGTKVEVKNIDGSGSLKIPAGTQSGKVFKLREKGMPRLQGALRGDQLVEVIVKVPKKLSAKEKKLYKELADANKDNIEKSGWFGVL